VLGLSKRLSAIEKHFTNKEWVDKQAKKLAEEIVQQGCQLRSTQSSLTVSSAKVMKRVCVFSSLSQAKEISVLACAIAARFRQNTGAVY